MAELRIKGMITSKFIGESKFDGKTKVDKDGVPVISRTVQVLDLESEQTDIYKVKFSADQEELVEKNLRNNCDIVAIVGTFNKYTFYNLQSLKAI